MIRLYLLLQLRISNFYAASAHYFVRRTGAPHWYEARAKHLSEAMGYAMQLDQLEINK